MIDLTGKVAIVTGGRRGIGLAIANALKAAGATVAVVAKSATGPGDLYLSCDLASFEHRGDLVKRVVDKFGRLDILINNAGAQMFVPAVDCKPGDWNRALELMVSAPFDLSQQAARVMIPQGGGHIVNILSTSAFQGARNITGYVAAKHALLGVTRCLSIEWAPSIHVNAVAPGLTETDMTTVFTPERRALLNSITPAGKFGKPEDVAGAVMYLVSSEHVYGQTIVVDGGWLTKNG
jgi:2-deoxy-D-gluconate 3-dehydrogenase